ncbi:MAG: hypothetical protein M1821_009340 [Bathelium mastoideum]|nr:MAG: hypothetical protein M1821_009340 [Bathelium mastoideum]
MEAVGFAASCLAIAELAAASIKHLHSLQNKLNHADRNIQMVTSQLISVKSAVNHIKTWLDQRPTGNPQMDSLDSDLGMSLEACRMLLDMISGHLGNLDSEPVTLAWKERLKYIWNEEEVQMYRNMLQDQIQALSLLLQVAQLPVTKQDTLLQSTESRKVIQRVRDDSSSLLLKRDTDSFRSDRHNPPDDLSRLDASFTFDQDIFRSHVYQSAMLSAIEQTNPEVSSSVSSWNSDAFTYPEDILSAKDMIGIFTATNVHEDLVYKSVNTLSQLVEASMPFGAKLPTDLDLQDIAAVFDVPLSELQMLIREAIRLERAKTPRTIPRFLRTSSNHSLKEFARRTRTLSLFNYYKKRILRREFRSLAFEDFEMVDGAWCMLFGPSQEFCSLEQFWKLLKHIGPRFRLNIHMHEYRVCDIAPYLGNGADGIAFLNNRLAVMPVKRIRKRRMRLSWFCKECWINADSDKGLDFQSVIQMLSIYNSWEGSDWKPRCASYVGECIQERRAGPFVNALDIYARHQSVQEGLQHDLLVNLLERIYWRRRFRTYYTNKLANSTPSDPVQSQAFLNDNNSSPSADSVVEHGSTLLDGHEDASSVGVRNSEATQLRDEDTAS